MKNVALRCLGVVFESVETKFKKRKIEQSFEKITKMTEFLNDKKGSNDSLTPGDSSIVASSASSNSSATSNVSEEMSEETKRINEQIESYLKEDWDNICENLHEINDLLKKLKKEKAAEYLRQILNEVGAAKSAGKEIDRDGTMMLITMIYLHIVNIDERYELIDRLYNQEAPPLLETAV